ncbi:BACON domain-containing protein [Streptomyces sp. NBC_01754]|uniref:BACON domain-containing protein n=1 Tax=Streptomyces sp. NBC_01754 TaxID=2975930 RepID=UPI003FA38A86
MTSSRLETPPHTTRAHRAHRRASHPSAQRSSVRYDPHLDGLFTYCLSVLCDHEAATEALGSVLAIAERQHGRCPAAEEERKTWLYALARWTCLRTLTEQKRGRQAHRRPAVPPVARRTPEETDAPDPESPTAEERRRELARLAWPEAAGTTPEQREALELAVRHRLTPHAVAAVLGLEPGSARELLAAAACEVERTRAALAVLETGDCATVTRLTGTHQVLLSSALRRELVRHVDDCPRCRQAAERAGAAGPWPGAAVTPAAALPVVEAPRPSVHVALVHARRSRPGVPRFGRTGFPMDPKDHAARRDRLRSRVVTTTVVATVVAAPVIALWVAYRAAPLTGEGRDGSSVTATEVNEPGNPSGDPRDHYENAGNAGPGGGGRFGDGGDRRADVSAEVVSAGPGPHTAGTLRAAARSSGGRTTITLTATGGGSVSWSARTDAPWLRLSRASGTLAPGRSTTLYVLVDRAVEPAGPWRAHALLAPSGSAVVITGHGGTRDPGPDPAPSSPGPLPTSPGPAPSSSPPSSPDPGPGTPGPTEPAPDPGGTAPGTPDPTPSPSGEPSAPAPSDPPAAPGDTRSPAG